MADTIKFLSLVVFLGLMIEGSLQCYDEKLIITQAGTGVKVESKPEWKVTVANKCTCTQLDVQLTCAGFQTVKKVDPEILAVSGGDTCTFNNDNPVYGNTSVSFTYAWDHRFPFAVASSQVACS